MNRGSILDRARDFFLFLRTLRKLQGLVFTGTGFETN